MVFFKVFIQVLLNDSFYSLKLKMLHKKKKEVIKMRKQIMAILFVGLLMAPITYAGRPTFYDPLPGTAGKFMITSKSPEAFYRGPPSNAATHCQMAEDLYKIWGEPVPLEVRNYCGF
jgi:hypothetical protein